MVEYLDINNQLASGPPPERRSTSSKISPMYGLVIEDNQEITEVYKNFLLKNQFKIDIASNLKDALHSLNNKIYSFIILDGQFPERYGENSSSNHLPEVINILKKQMLDLHYRPMIIHISGDDNLDDISFELKNGNIDCFIPKPFFNFKNLLKLIQYFSQSGISYGSRKSDILKNYPFQDNYFYMETDQKINNMTFIATNILDNALVLNKNNIFVSSPIAKYIN